MSPMMHKRFDDILIEGGNKPQIDVVSALWECPDRYLCFTAHPRDGGGSVLVAFALVCYIKDVRCIHIDTFKIYLDGSTTPDADALEVMRSLYRLCDDSEGVNVFDCFTRVEEDGRYGGITLKGDAIDGERMKRIIEFWETFRDGFPVIVE